MFQIIKTKNILISTQKYKDGGIVEKSVLDITVRLRNLKRGMKTIDVKDVDRTFVVKLRGLNIENYIFVYNYL